MNSLRIKELCRQYPEIKGFLINFENNKQENREYRTLSAHEKINKLFKEKEEEKC